MFLSITIIVAALLLAASLPALWKRWRAYRVWKSDLRSINQWARMDEFEERRSRLVASIYTRWPEAVVVNVLSCDPISYEERIRFAEGVLRLDVLLRIFRARPAAVRITLEARQHKMEICDARALNIPVTVTSARPRQLRSSRPGPSDAVAAASSPTRHGRTDERPADAPARSNSAGRP